MSENSLLINPSIEPFAGGVIGLGIGYTMAPRKYSLKRLLIMNPKKMSQIYSDNVIKQMNTNERNALSAIMTAKDEYKTSKLQNAEEIKKTAKIWHDEFKKVDVPQEIKDNFKQTRSALQDAIQKENFISLNKQYRKAKNNLKKAPENEELKKALTAANEALASARVRVAAKIEHYSNAVKNLYNERLYNIKSNPAKWTTVKEAYNNLLIAIAKRRTFASNKLFELSNNKDLIKSYNAIKDFLPKARTKAALTGGLVLGGITTLLAAYFSPSHARA